MEGHVSLEHGIKPEDLPNQPTVDDSLSTHIVNSYLTGTEREMDTTTMDMMSQSMNSFRPLHTSSPSARSSSGHSSERTRSISEDTPARGLFPRRPLEPVTSSTRRVLLPIRSPANLFVTNSPDPFEFPERPGNDVARRESLPPLRHSFPTAEQHQPQTTDQNTTGTADNRTLNEVRLRMDGRPPRKRRKRKRGQTWHGERIVPAPEQFDAPSATND